VILGAGRLGVEAAKLMARVEGEGRVLGWIGERGPKPDGLPRLGGMRALPALVARRGVTRAVIDSEALGPLTDKAVLATHEAGVPWVEAGELMERLSGRAQLERIDPRLMTHANGLEAGIPEAVALRRVVEIVVSAAILIAISPLLVAIAAIVKLDSPGPVLFMQERVGRGGRTFRLLKFRTMRRDAEAASGPVWAKAQDPRVTRIGRILRKTRLDELPQLLNVLRGDMSFIGPRPERQFFVDQIAAVEPAYRLRHVVRPGVTGWAQVNYRYGASVEDALEKLRYDLYYILHWSPLLDVEIAVETLRVILRGSNDH
jgi:exopolysaccharide biosynthesis polyprenyl glycosylphosphotransferase